jgi:hypothetical protein
MYIEGITNIKFWTLTLIYSFFLYLTQGLISNMGHVSKSQYVEIQNPRKSPFNNMDFM